MNRKFEGKKIKISQPSFFRTDWCGQITSNKVTPSTAVSILKLSLVKWDQLTKHIDFRNERFLCFRDIIFSTREVLDHYATLKAFSKFHLIRYSMFEGLYMLGGS